MLLIFCKKKKKRREEGGNQTENPGLKVASKGGIERGTISEWRALPRETYSDGDIPGEGKD